MSATSQNKEKFEDYEGFVDKFKPKKTTDDCYTPQAVYDEIVRYVDETIMPLEGVKILRPFYPGGDYENYDYPEGSVVIDNPPFSIISKICRFYNSRGIKYFLFAPALTLLGLRLGLSDESYIVAHCDIVYENGARVRTSFRTNMLKGNPRIRIAGDLYKRVQEVQKREPKSIRKIIYPDYVITPATLGRLCVRGIKFDIPAADCSQISKLDNMKGNLFGKGFLLSERAAAERAAAERAAAERAAAERVILSEREWAIIKNLGTDGG
jgi:hypothetical protein